LSILCSFSGWIENDSALRVAQARANDSIPRPERYRSLDASSSFPSSSRIRGAGSRARCLFERRLGLPAVDGKFRSDHNAPQRNDHEHIFFHDNTRPFDDGPGDDDHNDDHPAA
jgi:hypothetical protein